MGKQVCNQIIICCKAYSQGEELTSFQHFMNVLCITKRHIFVKADIMKKLHMMLIALNLIMGFAGCSCSAAVSFLFGFFSSLIWLGFFEIVPLVWP